MTHDKAGTLHALDDVSAATRGRPATLSGRPTQSPIIPG